MFLVRQWICLLVTYFLSLTKKTKSALFSVYKKLIFILQFCGLRMLTFLMAVLQFCENVFKLQRPMYTFLNVYHGHIFKHKGQLCYIHSSHTFSSYSKRSSAISRIACEKLCK